jgi:hypothetical protein
MGASHVGDVVFECVFEKQPSDRVTIHCSRGWLFGAGAGVQFLRVDRKNWPTNFTRPALVPD